MVFNWVDKLLVAFLSNLRPIKRLRLCFNCAVMLNNHLWTSGRGGLSNVQIQIEAIMEVLLVLFIYEAN